VLVQKGNCGGVSSAYVIYFGRYSDISSVSTFTILCWYRCIKSLIVIGYVEVCSSNGCFDGNYILNYIIILKIVLRKFSGGNYVVKYMHFSDNECNAW
jgi:hypothetical protein